MKKQLGLSDHELEQIFAQIKKGVKFQNLDKKIYDAYLPYIKQYATKFNLKEEKVQDIFDDVFSCVYQNIVEGTLTSNDFNVCFIRLMIRQCEKATEAKDEFQSEMLGDLYVQRSIPTLIDEEERIARIQFAEQSFLFTMQVLNELSQDPELAEELGLSEVKVNMIKDHYGINSEHHAYSCNEIAEKYNVTPSRACAMLAVALKNLRHMNEFASLRNRF